VPNTNTEIYYDPYSTEVDLDPHPVWSRMREEAPLYFNERYQFFALSRFEDVLEASKDASAFSSAHGTVLELLDAPIELVPNWLLFKDPPEHTRLRALVNRAFTPRRIADIEGRVRELACELLDRHVGTDSFDYVADFAARLPMQVIGSLLGVPVEDRDRVAELFEIFGETFGQDEGADYSQLTGLNAYFGELAARRRARPEDDLMTALVQAEVKDDDGVARRMSTEDISEFVVLLDGAGTDTVSKLLGWAALTLARHPEQRAMLVDSPDRIPDCVEELIRYEPPSPVQGRLVTRDVEFYGRTVPAGSKMLLLTGAASRDEREFERADEFDVTRRITRHLSFGYGHHFCLGAALARLEARVALEETLRRFPTWKVLDGAEMSHSSSVRGYRRVPIAV
jgi:cytochrome P450